MTVYLSNSRSRGPCYKIASPFIQHSTRHTINFTIFKRNLVRNQTPHQAIGADYINTPNLNKGLGFTLEERHTLRIHGLLPPRYRTQDQQMKICKSFLDHYGDPLDKYVYLMDLCELNEKLFYKLLSEHIENLMPVVYTPTVGVVCQKFGLIYSIPKGLFITIEDAGHIIDVLKNWPEQQVKAIVVTDGERILGLGDLGSYGMGIPVGKLALYTALAAIKPQYCLPITLDVGTNNETLLQDPLYIGLRRKRVTGKEYDDFLDEFMEAVVKCFGTLTLIQFEDFGSPNAIRLLKKYRSMYCTFNDDIQGTASSCLAGIFASSRISGKKLSENTFLFLGAGGAATGIARLLVKALVRDGLSKEAALEKIWLVDVDGLLTIDRSAKIDEHMKRYAKKHKPMDNFAEVVNDIKPSVLIGACAVGGAFTPEILKQMASFNERPVIFALSNPTPKAECTAKDAYVHTEGRAIFASGSPFDKVELGDKVFHPGQGNNAYIFPGVALGAILSGMFHIGEQIFLIASDTVAKNVTDEDLAVGRVYPPLRKIMECSIQIACNILEYSYNEHIASAYPQPENIRDYVVSNLYNFNYDTYEPPKWEWSKHPEVDI